MVPCPLSFGMSSLELRVVAAVAGVDVQVGVDGQELLVVLLQGLEHFHRPVEPDVGHAGVAQLGQHRGHFELGLAAYRDFASVPMPTQ